MASVALALSGCKPAVTEGDYPLGSNYVLSVESSRDIFIVNSKQGSEVPPTVFEIGWDEKYIIAKRTNPTVTVPEIWIINKAEQQTKGPLTAEDLVKEAHKNPGLQKIVLKSVVEIRAK